MLWVYRYQDRPYLISRFLTKLKDTRLTVLPARLDLGADELGILGLTELRLRELSRFERVLRVERE